LLNVARLLVLQASEAVNYGKVTVMNRRPIPLSAAAEALAQRSEQDYCMNRAYTMNAMGTNTPNNTAQVVNTTPIAELSRWGSGIETPRFYGILNFAESSRLTLTSAVSSKKTASAIPVLGPLFVGPLSLLTTTRLKSLPDTAYDKGFSSPICAMQCANLRSNRATAPP